MQLSGKLLQVWHYPNIPCEAFRVEVKDEFEAYKIMNVLADQHNWLEKNKFIPDFSNDIPIMMFDKGEWVEYYNTHEEMDWNDFEYTYEQKLKTQNQ